MPAISVLIFIRQGAYFQWLVVTMNFSKGFAGSEEWPLSCLWGRQAFLCILPFFLLHFLLAQLGQYETLWRCSFWRRQSQQVFFDKPTVCATQRLCLPRGVIPITRACASYVILMYLHTYIPVLQWEDATRNFSGVWAELPFCVRPFDPFLWWDLQLTCNIWEFIFITQPTNCLAQFQLLLVINLFPHISHEIRLREVVFTLIFSSGRLLLPYHFFVDALRHTGVAYHYNQRACLLFFLTSQSLISSS